jgi:hypothetical protein
MENVKMERIKVVQHTSNGLLWLMGWLFTLGYLHLTFWTGIAALFVWPYFLGVRIATLLVK